MISIGLDKTKFAECSSKFREQTLGGLSKTIKKTSADGRQAMKKENKSPRAASCGLLLVNPHAEMHC